MGDWNANPDLTLDFKKQILDKIILQATLDANSKSVLVDDIKTDEVSLQTKFSYSEAKRYFQVGMSGVSSISITR